MGELAHPWNTTTARCCNCSFTRLVLVDRHVLNERVVMDLQLNALYLMLAVIKSVLAAGSCQTYFLG